MNTAHIKAPEESNRFVDLVDFKWLMAGMGWWVNLSRLQSDQVYIDECFQRAMTSDSQLLRKRSVEMFGLPDAPCDAAPPH
jgi:hypothetical protein